MPQLLGAGPVCCGPASRAGVTDERVQFSSSDQTQYRKNLALAGMAELVGCCPVNRRVLGSIPGEGIWPLIVGSVLC